MLLLLGEAERYVLRGPVYAALMPLLDGTRSADAMADQLSECFRPEIVHFALIRMGAGGYTQAVNGCSAPAPEAAWWSAKGISLAEVAAGLKRQVHLDNAGGLGAVFQAIRASLSSRFELCDALEAAHLAVILTEDYLDPRFDDAIAQARSAECLALPVRIGGGQIWIGPLLEPQDPALFAVLRRRLTVSRVPEAPFLAQKAVFPLVPSQSTLENDAFAAAALLNAISATLVGKPPAGIRNSVLAIDPWTLESRAHPIGLGERRAPTAAMPAFGDDGAPVVLHNRTKRSTTDGGYRSSTPEETLSRLEPLVSEITGIVPTLQKMEAPEGVYVYVASQLFGENTGRSADHRQNRVLGRASYAGGKGLTDIQAKVSCIGEAIERYSASAFGDEPRRRARLDTLGDRAISPLDLMHFSERQYAEREQLNKRWGTFNWVPMPFDASREIDWTPAWSLTNERTIWLPTAFCYIRHPSDPDHMFCQGNSNGCAAGNTIEEAILQGFLELVERDACAVWWYNRLSRPGIDLNSFASPYLDRMQALYRAHGRTLIALDITNDLGVPTIIAISWREADGGRIHVGLGTHLNGALAVSRAVSELNQSTWNELLPEAGQAPSAPSINSDFDRWLAEATIGSAPYVLPASGVRRTAADFHDQSCDDLKGDIEHCIRLVGNRGLDMIVLDQTRPDIGFPVVRVAVPGLRHFWARFAPGRLYDVPVAMGWRDCVLDEADLNPDPFFI